MARPRDFDERQTVQKAMGLFWLCGYQGTSLSDLEEALGVGRKSLSNAFGNKRELFLKALDTYITKRPPVEQDGAGWDEIVATFNGGPPYNPKYRSCFLVNTVIEFGPLTEDDVAARVERHTEQLRQGFERAVTQAISDGHIPKQNAGDAAWFLCSALQGLSVMARAGTQPAQLHAIAKTTLATLESV